MKSTYVVLFSAVLVGGGIAAWFVFSPDKPPAPRLEPIPKQQVPEPAPNNGVPPAREPYPPGFDLAQLSPQAVHPCGDDRVLALNQSDALLWSLTESKPLGVWRHSPHGPSPLTHSCASPDGTRLATIDVIGARILFQAGAAVVGPGASGLMGEPARIGRIIDLGTSKSLLLRSSALLGSPQIVGWSATGDRLLLVEPSGFGPIVPRLFDTTTGMEIGVVGQRGPERSPGVPEFNRGAGGFFLRRDTPPTQYDLYYFSGTGISGERGLDRVLFSPAGRYLMTSAGEKDKVLGLFVWQVRDGSLATNLTLERRKVLDIAFRPDDRWLALLIQDHLETGAAEGPVLRVLDPETGATLSAIRNLQAPRSVVWVQDGKQLIVTEKRLDTERIRCLDATTGAEVWKLEAPAGGTVGGVAVQPHGNLVACTVVEFEEDPWMRRLSLHVLDAATGKPAWNATPVQSAARTWVWSGVMWSPDGKYLLRGSLVPELEIHDAKGVARGTFSVNREEFIPSIRWDPRRPRLFLRDTLVDFAGAKAVACPWLSQPGTKEVPQSDKTEKKP